ncbi:MAG: hypothetical protein EXR73_01800 [Myxococcales bacterium]|nr:hypothetical protein [Myxococcales bacterium]
MTSINRAVSTMLSCLALAAVACSETNELLPPVGGGAPIPCVGGCPEGQKCHYLDGSCVHAGIADCGVCADSTLCSPVYPVPACVVGTCAPPTTFRDGTVKLVSLAVAEEARGCDLDGDGAPNNRFASLPRQALNDEFARAIATDLMTILLEPSAAGWGEAGPTFDASLWFGTLAPQSRQCSPESVSALCSYTVSRASYDPASPSATCGNWLRFGDVARIGALIASPSPGPVLDLVVPVERRRWLLQFLGARLEADVSEAEVVGAGLGPRLDGRICAALPKSDLLLAIASLPPESVEQFGGSDVIQSVVDVLVEPDLDADGDGEAESVSMALDWTGVPARIVGYSPNE